MGIGPFQSRPGDLIAVLFGADYLIALRPTGREAREGQEGGGFELLGNVYVQGCMNGELVRNYVAGNTACAEYFRIY